MGFRSGAYAKVWEIKPSENGKTTTVRLSVSRKNKDTDEYVQEFSGLCFFIGKANIKAREQLSVKDRIQLTECDVTTDFNKTTKENKVYFKVWDFESPTAGQSTPPPAPQTEPEAASDNGDYPF